SRRAKRSKTSRAAASSPDRSRSINCGKHAVSVMSHPPRRARPAMARAVADALGSLPREASPTQGSHRGLHASWRYLRRPALRRHERRDLPSGRWASSRTDGSKLIQDLKLGHLGSLDVLDADLRGELFDDAQEVGAGERPGREGFLDLAG